MSAGNFAKVLNLTLSIYINLSIYQLYISLLGDIQRATSNDPLCYVDETLQEATDGAVVIHLEVNDI